MNQYSHESILAWQCSRELEHSNGEAEIVLVTVGQARAEAETEERGDSGATWYCGFFSFSLVHCRTLPFRGDDRGADFRTEPHVHTRFGG